MSLIRTAAAGALAALIQTAFLLHFASPLAETLHEKLAAVETEEVYAYWAAWAVAALSGALWGVLFYPLALRHGVFKTSAAMFIALSLLPSLKWLPTPHGVSYLEPVWWREAIHGLYLLYNAVFMLVALRGGLWGVAAAAALAVGVYAFPSFTLPDRYLAILPELRALQGLAISSWALFWASIALLTWLISPVRRIWR
ncbi:MAG: hypothetical protein ACK4M3_07595 [Pyrobaculum sp.]